MTRSGDYLSPMEPIPSNLPRVAVFDLDGTLLRTDKTVSTRTRRALSDLEGMGVQLAVATARAPAMVQRLAPPELARATWITHNGALAVREGRELFRQFLQPGSLGRVVALAQTCIPVPLLCAEIDGRLVSSRDVTHLWGPGFEVVDFRSLQDGSIPKILLGLEDCPWFQAPLRETFGGQYQIDVTDGGAYAQIHAPGVTKDQALDRWFAQAGIRWDEVAAFGDDVTDSGMIGRARFGVAMGNAPEGVRSVAAHVCPTNDEDGLAIFLERWTLPSRSQAGSPDPS